jgi:hypothetical protein
MFPELRFSIPWRVNDNDVDDFEFHRQCDGHENIMPTMKEPVTAISFEVGNV